MNIQLFLADQEVELNKKVSFPLNKSFENLWNPLDIVIEHTKSINIPASQKNNILMANAYRIDKQFVINNNNSNIGLYLDPMKRIPMKLVYNNSTLLDGYAKYQSSTSNDKETYYTFNIYGILGEVFHALLDCVVDEAKLTDTQRSEEDGGKKYVLGCPWESRLINREFVKDSWDSKLTSTNTNTANPHRHIGMAPAYRGYYSDFESNSIWVSTLDVGPNQPNVMSVEDYLKRRWKTNLISNHNYSQDAAQSRVDALDFNMILPNGLNEHNMRQFRSYEQKPYIYFYSLMDIYRKKCKELTGYEIKLDETWFNINNPYWTRLCYMFDYLSVKGSTLDASLPLSGHTELKFKDKYCTSSVTYNINDNNIVSKGNIIVDPFTLGLRVLTGDASSTCINPGEVQINMRHRNYVTIDIAITTGGKTVHKYFWGGTGTPSNTANVGPSTGNNNKYPHDEYIYMDEKTVWDKDNNRWEYTSYLTTRPFEIEHTAGDSINITYNLQFGRDYVAGDYLGWYGWYTSTDGQQYSVPVFVYDWGTDKWANVVDSDRFMYLLPNITYSSNWRTSTTCDLKNLYTRDESLFNVILQYTKMFSLIWKPDYHNKTIDLMTHSSYFKDYNVVDWTDKVDKSKGMIVEPVSFNSKYVTFNYEDVEGYRYSGYKNKYGIDYGEKKLITKYNFDTNEELLMKQKIYPSSISTKAYSTITDLQSWDTISTLPKTISEINFIDCESEDEQTSISLNNWYFRLDNKGTEGYYLISDASPVELTDGKYYWVNNVTANGQVADLTQVLPRFSPVFPASDGNPTIGCLFECPKDDYTKDFQMATAQGRYIYDNCWSDYISERYDGNNKKVTCRVRLLPSEYEAFNFKIFVIIDNQLFSINKIKDYDINNKIAVIELVQVTDINRYIERSIEFPMVIYYGDDIIISPDKQPYGGGYMGYGGIKVRCYPRLDKVANITISKVSGTNNSTLEIYDWQAAEEDIDEDDPLTPVNSGDGTLVLKWTSSTFSSSEEWKVEITTLGETKTIPIYILEN